MKQTYNINYKAQNVYYNQIPVENFLASNGIGIHVLVL